VLQRIGDTFFHGDLSPVSNDVGCAVNQLKLESVRIRQHSDAVLIPVQDPVKRHLSVDRAEITEPDAPVLMPADAAAVLAQAMAEEIRGMNLPADTVMTWVTMPVQRFRERGIDHGRELCAAVSKLCGIPMRQLLTRQGRFKTQRGLHQDERMKNLNGTFVCTEELNVPVLLVDDVTTTGATVSVCAEALLAAGAPLVEVITATRVSHISQEKMIRKADADGFYTF
jgi:hypothetical protein